MKICLCLHECLLKRYHIHINSYTYCTCVLKWMLTITYYWSIDDKLWLVQITDTWYELYTAYLSQYSSESYWLKFKYNLNLDISKHTCIYKHDINENLHENPYQVYIMEFLIISTAVIQINVQILLNNSQISRASIVVGCYAKGLCQWSNTSRKNTRVLFIY